MRQEQPLIQQRNQTQPIEEDNQHLLAGHKQPESVVKQERERPLIGHGNRIPIQQLDSLPIQNVHGTSAQEASRLQAETAQVLGMQVEFSDTLKNGTQGPTMVLIPQGRFLMGSSPSEPERQNDEYQHEVTLKAFAISKYEVTFEEYDRFATATGAKKPSDEGCGHGLCPVINLSWSETLTYVEWLSRQTGQPYRLPTEAEWEYATRAGTVTPFYFGNNINTDQANYNGNFSYNGGAKGIYQGKTMKVGQFPPNAWGLHDPHGNVWEWTCSEYDHTYEGAGEQSCLSQRPPEGDLAIVVRGGAWNSEPQALRSAYRYKKPLSSFPVNNLGFRVVRSLTH